MMMTTTRRLTTTLSSNLVDFRRFLHEMNTNESMLYFLHPQSSQKDSERQGNCRIVQICGEIDHTIDGRLEGWKARIFLFFEGGLFMVPHGLQ